MFLNDFFDDKYFNTLVRPSQANFNTARNTDTPCNIYQLNNSYIFDLYLPGFSREDFDINVENSILTIKGKTSDNAKRNYIHQEYNNSFKFERAFSLPKNINIDDIDADYTSGILSISVPLLEKQKPTSRKITIG
jgi:HSP20 family protein